MNFSVTFAISLGIILSISCNDVTSSVIRRGPITLGISPSDENNALVLNFLGLDGQTLLTGYLGMSLPNAVGNHTLCSESGESDQCYAKWDDFAQVKIEDGSTLDCIRVSTVSSQARQLEDCFDMEPDTHWYGGGETHTQTWPIENNPRKLSPYVSGDFLQSHDMYYGGVIEKYWLLSNGLAIIVNDETPLFFSLNTTRPNKVCFVAKDQAPYTMREELTLKYELCANENYNLKETHRAAMSTFYGKPTGKPDERMMIQPFWSTWAEYKEDVSQDVVLEFARRVVSEGFVNSSHIEIDDDWETCYGQEEFSTEKFPNPKAMIDEIKSMNNMRVTAWVHPFINYECPNFDEAVRNNYFVQSSKPRTGITWWWQGTSNAGIIDMTNPDATAWWTARLRKLQEETGLTSYKFDAGETNWLPAAAQFNAETNSKLWPDLYTTKYVETCAEFGGLIETRSGHRNQKQPIFIRMLDKDSRWGYDNGLQSMIPTLLYFGMVGYAYVLPDMIGGNAYGDEKPSQELYVRWMQVNAFMPSVQFSLAPWRIGDTDAEKAETVRICLKVLADREKYASHILKAADQAVSDGDPMNRPLFWVDPSDKETLTIDDEYMLGDTILVAPVVKEGATSRDIYLPAGSWTSGVNGEQYTGQQWLRDYPAPLDVVPFFIKDV